MNNHSDSVSNVFRTTRENLNLTRDQASELITCITAAKLEKIERGITIPQPDDVICLARGYNNPHLLSHYCSNICEIGKLISPSYCNHNLCEIIINLLACSEYLERNRKPLTKLISSKEVALLSDTSCEINPQDLLTVISVINAESFALSLWLKTDHK